MLHSTDPKKLNKKKSPSENAQISLRMEICNWQGWEGRDHLQEETETWDKGGAQESMEVSLAVTYSFGDMEPKEAISCFQARNPMEQ